MMPEALLVRMVHQLRAPYKRWEGDEASRLQGELQFFTRVRNEALTGARSSVAGRELLLRHRLPCWPPPLLAEASPVLHGHVVASSILPVGEDIVSHLKIE
ncbi:DNA-directed RNA polymerase subunit alpha [Sesbania bispinosa]|nr:DNA-directed RNA polymerase subunit alpha [Sesbania bispinosa]